MAYETIDGNKYEKELLDLARHHTTGAGEGKLSKDEVAELFKGAGGSVATGLAASTGLAARPTLLLGMPFHRARVTPSPRASRSGSDHCVSGESSDSNFDFATERAATWPSRPADHRARGRHP